MLQPRNKLLLTGAMALVIAIPALAQESILPPGFGEPAPAAQPVPAPASNSVAPSPVGTTNASVSMSVESCPHWRASPR